MNKRKTQELLHQYLERIEAGKLSYKDALRLAKKQDPALYTLLRKALPFYQFQKHATPNQYYKQASKNRLLYKLSGDLEEARKNKPAKSYKKDKLFSFNLKPFLSAAFVAILSFGVLVGGAQAADTAAPGDFLYPIDLWMEQAQITFANSESEKIRLILTFSEERIAEAEKLFRDGDIENGNIALIGYEAKIAMADQILAQLGSEQYPELKALVSAATARNSEVLAGLVADLPPQAQNAVLHAIEASDHLADPNLPTPTVLDTPEDIQVPETAAEETETPVADETDDDDVESTKHSDEVLEEVEEAKATKDAEKEEDKATKEAEKEEDKEDKDKDKEDKDKDKEDKDKDKDKD